MIVSLTLSIIDHSARQIVALESRF